MRKILNKALEIRQRTKEVDKKLQAFIDIITPDKPFVFIDNDELSGFIEGIRLMNTELGDDLAWFFYEIDLDGKKQWIYSTTGGNVYNIKNADDFLDMLEDKYNS